MKKRIFTILAVFFLVAIGIVFFLALQTKNPPGIYIEQPLENQVSSAVAASQSSRGENQLMQNIDIQKQTINPIGETLSRITKKPFGILIDPKTSPVQPERFSGYHTGADLEVNTEEQTIDVKISALCEGKLLSAKSASGYGGVAVQACTLEGQAVTVVYGHLNLKSIKVKSGELLKAGDFLGNLGDAYSSQTDGERKHLHLAIHKGGNINILGYVQSKAALTEWIDPVKFLN
jgi:murein DD-endopeptidase MepM/ murein hydrolase activator NlpD